MCSQREGNKGERSQTGEEAVLIYSCEAAVLPSQGLLVPQLKKLHEALSTVRKKSRVAVKPVQTRHVVH